MILNKLILVGLLGLGSIQAKASFDENARRYLSAQEIIQAMQVHFDVPEECATVNDANASMLGVNSAVTGSAIAPAPTQATVQFVAGCVSKAIERAKYGSQFPVADAKLKVMLGDELMKELTKPYPPNIPTNLTVYYRLSEPWNQLPGDIQEKYITRIVYVMLGSDEVINDFGLIEPVNLRAKLAAWAQGKPTLTVVDMIKFISVNLAVRDEFLSY